MLCLIPIIGGLLIMMGHHSRSEALFYYFRLEDQILKTICCGSSTSTSASSLRQQLKDSYSETGRPSIDPELLLRILLIGYLYGITSERKPVDELRMHVAWRWFTVWASIRRFHITPRSPKAGMDGFRNRSCSRSCLRKSCASV
jgi:hypothetical protein